MHIDELYKFEIGSFAEMLFDHAYFKKGTIVRLHEVHQVPSFDICTGTYFGVFDFEVVGQNELTILRLDINEAVLVLKSITTKSKEQSTNIGFDKENSMIQLIAKQQLEIEQHKLKIKEILNLANRLHPMFCAKGQPFDSNLLKFDKEQLSWCSNVFELIDDIIEMC